MKSKTTAGILALLLGGIGAHKFYLDRAGQGILYLLFFWTFIPAMVALVEGLIYLTMSDQAFNAKYNAGLSAAGSAPPTIVNVTSTATANGRSVATEIRELKTLRDAGDLTEAEFQSQKAKLLQA